MDERDERVSDMWRAAVRATIAFCLIIVLAVLVSAGRAEAMHLKYEVPKPPARFDRLPGNYVIHEVSLESLRSTCGHGQAVGCALMPQLIVSSKKRACIILVPKNAYLHLRNQIIRHEFGHCNGWPPNHPD